MKKPHSRRLDFETPMRVFLEQTGIQLAEDDFLLADDLEFREPWIVPRLTWHEVAGGWQLGEAAGVRLGAVLRAAGALTGNVIAFLAVSSLVVFLACFFAFLGTPTVCAYLLLIAAFLWIGWRISAKSPRVPPERVSYFPDDDRVALFGGEVEIPREAIEYVVVSASLTKRSYQRIVAGSSFSFPRVSSGLRTDWQIVFRDGGRLRRRTLASRTSGGEGSPVVMTDAIPDVFSIKHMASELNVPAVIVKLELLQERFFVRRFE